MAAKLKTVRVPLVARVSMEFLSTIEALALTEDMPRSRVLAELIETHPRILAELKAAQL